MISAPSVSARRSITEYKYWKLCCQIAAGKHRLTKGIIKRAPDEKWKRYAVECAMKAKLNKMYGAG